MTQKVICLDCGHNAISRGVDSGASGYGLLEQDLTLDIGKRLKYLLQVNGFVVVMTREGDSVAGNYTSVTGSLQARCDISDRNKVDLFISLHINAGGGTGVEIFVTSLNGNANKCANAILPYLVNAGQWANRGVKTANDYVLVHTEASAILIEHGFIDNKSDATKLADPNFRQLLAIVDCKGICDYFGIAYKEQIITTLSRSNTSTIQAINNNQGSDNDMLEIAILKYSFEDEWSAKDIDAKLGGIANFTRQGINKTIPPACLNSKLLIIIGGSDIPSHSNRIYLSGETKYDTAQKVALYLG